MLLLVVGLVVAIAAVLVVREAIRLATAPPPVVFALDEAYEWVVERLPDEVAATLEHAGLHGIAVIRDGDPQRFYARVLRGQPFGYLGSGVGAAVLGQDHLVIDALCIHLRDHLGHLGLEAFGLVVDGDDHRVAGRAGRVRHLVPSS